MLAVAALAVSATFFSAGPAQAGTVFQGPFTFGDCPGLTCGVGTGNLIIGDKEFLNFTCLAADNLCASIVYTNVPSGDFGVEFNPGAALNLAAQGSRDALLEFQVIVTGGAFRIADFFLSSNSAQTGSGSVADTLEICTTQSCTPGTVLIGPTILSGTGINFPDTNLPCLPPNGQNCTYTSLWIIDDIATSVGADAGAAQISRLDKVVTQVPEPASLLLIGAGLLGMGFVRRRGAK